MTTSNAKIGALSVYWNLLGVLLNLTTFWTMSARRTVRFQPPFQLFGGVFMPCEPVCRGRVRKIAGFVAFWVWQQLLRLCDGPVHVPVHALTRFLWLWNCAEQKRLAPDVNRILFVRNLPYKISSEEMYNIFGKWGAIRQIRV